MKSTILRLFGLCSIFAALVLSAPSLRAEAASPGELIRRAYATLAVADHDYKGHRVDAMKQLEAAAKALKMDIRGDGRGRERQGVSDEQLRIARETLEQARGALRGKALKHVDRAIEQINVALKIR